MEMPSDINAWSTGFPPRKANWVPLEDTPREHEPSGDRLTAESSLRALPAARAGMVRRALRLAMDPDYPPREVLDQIARLFALRWPRE